MPSHSPSTQGTARTAVLAPQQHTPRRPRGQLLLACVPPLVYVTGDDGKPVFVPAPKLTDDDVQAIVETTAKRVVRLLERRGLLDEGNPDPLFQREPLLATLTVASVQGTVATGDRAGQRVRRRLLDP